MKRILIIFAVLMTGLLAHANDSLTVFYRIRLDQDIDQSAQRLVVLGLEKAAKADADYVLLDLDTYGGAVDAAGFTQGGFRAAGVTGLNHKLERYYHTRLDSYDNMNEDGIANCFAATVKTLEMFDNGAKQ